MHTKRRQFLQTGAALALSACTKSNSETKGSDAGAPPQPSHSAPLAPSSSANPIQSAARAQPVPEIGDKPLKPKNQEEFPEWPGGTDSESNTTVLMFRGNARRCFYGTGPLLTNLIVKWRYRMSALHISNAAKGDKHWSGTGWTGQAVKWGKNVYVGGVDGRFYCWDSETGALRWILKTERMFKSSPCFYRGRLYVGNVDDHVRAIDARTGNVVWSYDTRFDCDSSPVVVGNTLYFAGESGIVHALDPDSGLVRWKLDLGSHRGPGGSQGIESSPAIDKDELYVSTFDGNLYCIERSDGKVMWKYNTGDDTDVTAVLTDDRIYVASEEKNPVLHCVERGTGKGLWTFRSDGGFWSTPAISNNRVYIGSESGYLFCIDAKEGKRLWDFPCARRVWSSPCVVDGKVVFGSYDGFLYMLDAMTGRELWKYDMEGNIASTPCIVDGRIYIGGTAGYFYCFAPPGA